MRGIICCVKMFEALNLFLFTFAVTVTTNSRDRRIEGVLSMRFSIYSAVDTVYDGHLAHRWRDGMYAIKRNRYARGGTRWIHYCVVLSTDWEQGKIIIVYLLYIVWLP